MRNYRKPLIVIAPKTLLRLSAASSDLADMGEGTSFSTVLSDPRSVYIRVSGLWSDLRYTLPGPRILNKWRN